MPTPLPTTSSNSSSKPSQVITKKSSPPPKYSKPTPSTSPPFPPLHSSSSMLRNLASGKWPLSSSNATSSICMAISLLKNKNYSGIFYSHSTLRKLISWSKKVSPLLSAFCFPLLKLKTGSNSKPFSTKPFAQPPSPQPPSSSSTVSFTTSDLQKNFIFTSSTPSKYKNSSMKQSSALTLSFKLKTSIHHFLSNSSRYGPNNNGQKTFHFRPLKF